MVTTRSGRQIRGGRDTEFRCGCGVCDQTQLHQLENMYKCRKCNVHVLINHLSTVWTCNDCFIMSDDENEIKYDDSNGDGT